MSGSIRILCVGDDLDLIRTRCAVLGYSGYDAHAATPEQVSAALKAERYDLVIFSILISQRDRERIFSAAGETPPSCWMALRSSLNC
jgi:CheY-like chemotaxis protein